MLYILIVFIVLIVFGILLTSSGSYECEDYIPMDSDKEFKYYCDGYMDCCETCKRNK